MIYPFEGTMPDLSAALYVAPAAVVIGRVTVGAGSSIWHGAVVRGDIEPIAVGEGTNIQDNAVLHCSHGKPIVIGSGVTIGHSAVIHGCTIEDDVLVGMHATVLNNAVIGKGSIVAAGAVVAEGTVVPPGSLVMGVPGKVRGAVKPEQKPMIAASAREYVELAEKYKKQGE